jgi:5'-3' exonuclease
VLDVLKRIRRAQAHLDCDRVVLAFDSRRSIRHETAAWYKAGRTLNTWPYTAALYRTAQHHDLPCLGVEGWEADDVIATLAAHEGGPVATLSSDNDLLQLAEADRVVCYQYARKGVEPWLTPFTEPDVEAKYGLNSLGFLPDFKALMGEPGDGWEGVPKIGKKTAAKLLNQYGSLEGLRDAGRLDIAWAVQALAAREVLRLRYDLPIRLPTSVEFS